MCDFRIIACECCGGDGGWLEGDRWQACTACDDGQVEIGVRPVTLDDLSTPCVPSDDGNRP